MSILFIIGLQYANMEVEKLVYDEMVRENSSKLQRIESKIASNVGYFINHLQTLSRLLDEHADESTKHNLLKSYLYSIDSLVDITLISKNSFELMRVNKYHIIKPSKKSFFKEDFYRYPLVSGKHFIGNVRISTDTGEPLVDISFVLQDRVTGEKWGVVKATFSASSNWNFFESELSDDITLGAINATDNFLISRFGKNYPNLKQMVIDASSSALCAHEELYIFTQAFSLTNSKMLFYIIYPKKNLEQKVTKLKEEYIPNIFIFLGVLFVVLFVMMSYFSSRLGASVKKISSLAKGLTTLKEETKHPSDEIANLEHSIDLLTIALEQKLQKDQLLQQQSKLASMGEMIGAIAHQWRQPLNALNINIQNLEEDFEEGLIDQEFIEEFMTKNRNIIEFMSKTIDDFRNFFRIDKEKQHFFVEEVISDVLSIQSAQLKNHNISIEVSGDDFSIDGYKSEFGQVLLNIINNSKDAIVQNNIENGYIKIKLHNHQIDIIDNGGGIPQDIIERIYEPYFTTKEQGKGTGMGLYMSKMIIEGNMGGRMKASSNENLAIISIIFEGKSTI
jgi:signal transduction histidine kinase